VRAITLALALGALLVATGLGLLLVGPANAKGPSRLLVEATEYHLTVSRTTITPGQAIVQLADKGMDPHDLKIVKLGGGRARSVPETLPGALSQWQGTLTRGRYRLYCSLPGHERLGMRAVIAVR
jgi:hypothetical protein